MSQVASRTRIWWWLYAAAALSFVTTLTLPYIGEEAVYTITSLEMRLNHDFFVTTLYGTNYGRPPLLNWLVIPLTESLGWQYVLLASRLITAAASILTGLVTAWLMLNLTRNRELAALSAAVFLSGDVLFYRGWLAYSDALLTLFVFGAIACLWVGARRRRTSLLWLAAVLVTGGFLAKVLTAYLFYGVAFAALALERDTRRFLLAPASLAALIASLAVLVAWNVHFTHGLQSGSTLTDIALKLKSVELGAYVRQLWSFPLETVLRFAPASLVAGYFAWRSRGAAADPAAVFPWRTLCTMLAINYLPYWLGPKTHIRYIMPLYPLLALLIAAVLWRCGEQSLRIALRWLVAAVVLRYAIGLWGFPWYQANYRGDYAATAAKIMATVGDAPLYATDVSATGLSVAAHIDTARYPAAYLHWPPAQWDYGYVLSYTADPSLGEVRTRYAIGGNELFLLCRGAACTARGQ